MNQKDDSPDASASEPVNNPKKPYEKPAFRHERVFETRALSCGKVQVTESGCGFHRRTS